MDTSDLVWNRIPDAIRQKVLQLALDAPELSPRELAVRFTDSQGYFVSEASVYRLLKARDLVTSPAFIVVKAADEFEHKTTAPNQPGRPISPISRSSAGAGSISAPFRGSPSEPEHRYLAGDALRHDLQGPWHRASADEAQSSMDEWPGRADEPYDQGRHRERYHYECHEAFRQHLNDFVAAYTFARRLTTLNGLTPYEYICNVWTTDPNRFTLDPTHQTPGLNS
jgi:hypothetical protein